MDKEKMDDTQLIKQILLKLFVITDDKIDFNDMWFMDTDLKNMLRQLSGGK
jgi:hypothetical protein